MVLAACERSVSLGPGVHAPLEPLQRSSTGLPIKLRRFVLSPRAEFEVTGKILSKRNYRRDRLAAVVPWDFALGWGPMSDEQNLRALTITQGSRFAFIGGRVPGLERVILDRSYANLHLSPADTAIEEALAAVPSGALIRLRGRLVDLSLPDGALIPTSLDREDTGPGACEIMFVQSAVVLRGNSGQ